MPKLTIFQQQHQFENRARRNHQNIRDRRVLLLVELHEIHSETLGNDRFYQGFRSIHRSFCDFGVNRANEAA